MKKRFAIILTLAMLLCALPFAMVCTAEAEADIPAELVGVWQGVGTPKNNGSSIDLTVSVDADGSGEYTFDQNGYHENNPFTISRDGNRFSVNTDDSQLGRCEGTWALENGTLTLDITTTFPNGRTYSYVAKCTKAGESGEETALDENIDVPSEQSAGEPTPEPTEDLPDVKSLLDGGAQDAANKLRMGSIGLNERVGVGINAAENAAPIENGISDADMTDVILDALGDDLYRSTYDALLSGEVVQKGSRGDTARGVQQTLVAFGQNISVDGSAGPKTLAALNAVQAAFGLEQTDVLGAEGYALLLPRLLLYTDSDAAYRTFYAEYDGSGEYEYMLACVSALQGRYATAKKSFEDSQWGDWQARAEACAQPWPKTGVLYKNPDVKGSSTELTVKFNTDPDTAMLVKIYTVDGVLARTMFIGGTGKATASLPAGAYIIKDGTGKNWYGEEESFGAEGYYEIMTFDNGEQQLQLKKNYRSTITVNVQEADPESDRVGSEHESWNDF